MQEAAEARPSLYLQPEASSLLLSSPYTQTHTHTHTSSASCTPAPASQHKSSQLLPCLKMLVASQCISNIVQTAHLRRPLLPHSVPSQPFPPLHAAPPHAPQQTPALLVCVSFSKHALPFPTSEPLLRLCSDLNCPPSISTRHLPTLPPLLEPYCL